MIGPALLRRLRARRRDQGGFALLAGLMVWLLLCGVTLIALLGMTLSASKVSIEEAVTSRQIRAADAALEAAINQIREDPDATMGAYADSGVDGDCVEDLGTGSGLTYSDDVGTDVVVTAECEPSTQEIPDPSQNTNVVAEVDLVGDGYMSPSGLPETVDWRADCPVDPTTACYPWKAGIGAPNLTAQNATIQAAQESLIHTSHPDVDPASATLTIAGDTTVRTGGMPLINPPRVDGTAGVSVAGGYQQGAAGLFDSVGGTNGCGILGPSFPWAVAGARVVDSDDAAGAPTCNTAVTTATSGLGAPTNWNQISPLRTTPACSGSAGSVISFEAGAYTRTQTAAINDLLTGGCSGRVFWFKPGNYWFDVDDTSNGPAERNSLVIDDPSVRVIFGEPAGGNDASSAASASFPLACNDAAAGVSITLTPRTSVRHKQGQVAVCDLSASDSASTPPPAVWQTADADGGWSGTPGTGSITLTRDSSWIAWGSSNLSNQNAAWAMDNNNATATFSCNVIGFGSCSADVNVSAQSIGSSTPAPAEPIASSRVRSLDLLVKASARNEDAFTVSLVGDNEASTAITFYKAGSATPTCGVGFPSIPDPRADNFQNTLAYDLFSTVADPHSGLPTCAQVRDAGGITRADLRGSRVDVRYRVYTWVSFLGFFDTVFSIDGLELRAGWDMVPTGGTNGSGWSNAGNITALDGAHTGYTLSGCPFLGSCATATRSMTATGLDNLTDPYVPTTGPLLKAGVIVTGETTNQNFFTNGSFYDLAGAPDVSNSSNMRVTVNNLAGGGSCYAAWSRIPFWGQGIYLDLLNSPGTCAGVLTSAEQLIGADATLEVYIQRNSWGANVDYGTRIDHLKISTVTGGTYTGPGVPNLVTEDVSGSATNRTSFNVFGPVSLPRNTLNLQWAGPPPTRNDGTDVPVIGGQTVLSSLGSYVGPDGEAGVLCCTSTRPAERIVVLHAKVQLPDGTEREMGTARVAVSDRGGFGSSVRVEEWTLA